MIINDEKKNICIFAVKKCFNFLKFMDDLK